MAIQHWNYHSAVTCCETCEGTGTVRAARRATIIDPYPESPCPDCDGEHLPECKVCGCGVIVPGYDCIACYVVGELPAHHLDAESIGQIAIAIAHAAKARAAQRLAA